MRCLHCGSTLSAFKKFTDGDFCSAEHRDSFYLDQQRLILERLKRSAARFHRLRRGSTANVVAASALQNNSAEETQAPAKLAEFLYAKLDLRHRVGPLWSFAPEFAITPASVNLSSRSRRKSESDLFASLIPDFPWPHYNAGSRYFAVVFDLEFGNRIEYGSTFDLRGDLRTALVTHGLLPKQNLSLANVRVQRSFPLRMAKPKTLIAMDSVRLARFDSCVLELPRFGYLNFAELPSQTTGLGVTRSILLEPLSPIARFALRASRKRAQPGEFAPPASTLPLRLAVRSVRGTATGRPADEISVISEVDFNGNLVLPEAQVSQYAQPGQMDRFFRPRPRPVADDHLVSAQPVNVELVGFVSHIANPPDRRRSNRLAPQQHGAVTSACGRQAPISLGNFPRSEALEATFPKAATPAVVWSNPQGAGDIELPMVIRLFRGRPRLAVTSDRAEAKSSIVPVPQPFTSAPANLSLGFTECMPAEMPRLFRIRPKAGVNADTAAVLGDVASLAFPSRQPEFGLDWWDVVSGAKPIFMNRMFRMRFKNPAQDRDTLVQVIRSRHIPVPDPEPVLASLPTSPATAAPSFLDRLYRMRPKSGKVIPPGASAIPCRALESRSGSSVPAAVLESVSRQWKATPVSIKMISLSS